ncbi:DeoR/GlpR family DNA-binding transcription regulator [Galbitalea sp. SE-J8]|uniref:DeoR/GlpR family DNA-binding transcription regulator n=1 Tax=Galbitalea sp. SE-J8 TaxID=3054952 RepID=UPI00259C9499|nr:DeoR/GlpR family DNA-binding transcription regulator [Galbitalea sp. SE-J8]MDM4764205.1 DeoR/GlpR family DNA-binding transcription regulator [Galbitalea sp. SE-J8]
MDVAERRTLIEERVIRTGEVSFGQLATAFGVSEMTIRRDIEALQEQGVLRRVSGGAISLTGTAFEPSYGLRAGQAVDSKAHIAERIVELLKPGETVVLDSGSTVASVARAIRGRGLGLTVLTPSITVATTLADEPDTRVILAGGVVRPGELSLIGTDTEQTFARYNCDVFVVGVAGVDAERGLTEYHPQEASVKRAALAASSRLIVGVDAAKLGRVHLVTVAPLDVVSALVTDGHPDHPAVVAARERGAQVVVVQPPAAASESAGESA